MEWAPIQDYAAVGNCRSVALVSKHGAIDWLCWPRFDSGSLFGRLLDPDGGTFQVAPVGPYTTSRAWVPHTNVLTTDFRLPGGEEVVLLDWMDVGDPGGILTPEHALIRFARCEKGPVELELRFEPRPNYGRSRARPVDAGPLGWRIETHVGLTSLRSNLPIRWTDEPTRVRLESGEAWILLLTWSSDAPASLPAPEPFAFESFERTVRTWRGWASKARYDGPYRDQVERSALTMKLLHFAPSGAIVAAGTTSLPEKIGGSLNWDYRYCWLRDSALTVRSLLSLGYDDEAEAFVAWLLHSTRLSRPRLHVLYDVYGRIPHQEEVLEDWSGYRNSKPVRIRNAAAAQQQLDVYGIVIDALTQLVRAGHPVDREVRSMFREFGEHVCRNWDQPDSSIWEPRTPPDHHTFSRLMSWVALERILELKDLGMMPRIPHDRFARNRELIRDDIENRGWNPELGAYTATLNGDELDTSLLLMSWFGYAPAASPRLRSTQRKIIAHLGAGPGLLYRNEQGLRDKEGAFGICSFWCAEYICRGGGSLEDAEDLFHMITSYSNDLGLFAEQVDPETGNALGNFPQAFTHIGLIGAALALEERREEDASKGRPHSEPPSEEAHP